MNEQSNAFTVVALAWIILMGGILFWENGVDVQLLPSSPVIQEVQPAQSGPQPSPEVVPAVDPQVGTQEATHPADTDPAAFAPPYEKFIVTQGLHGFSYGQMAVDISAGKGATIHSPINGKVTSLYVDQYGNTTLVVENEVYQVTMLHGQYSVKVGDLVKIGDPLGTESNQGYTLDMQGNLCSGRDCGYHMHINVFDKRLGSNINPLKLLGQ
jgi:murein DD-endopeptidase MepM/ murein hydrolase activator NlpD